MAEEEGAALKPWTVKGVPNERGQVRQGRITASAIPICCTNAGCTPGAGCAT